MAAHFRFKFCGYVRVQRQSGSHIMMLPWKHHDVYPVASNRFSSSIFFVSRQK